MFRPIMYNPFLTKEAALEAIEPVEVTATFTIPTEIREIRDVIWRLMDYGMHTGAMTEEGADYTQPENEDFLLQVGRLENHWGGLLHQHIRAHTQPVTPQPNDEWKYIIEQTRAIREALYNAIEHAESTHVLTREEVVANYITSYGASGKSPEDAPREANIYYDGAGKKNLTIKRYEPGRVEVHASEKGELWIIEQKYGGQKMNEKLEGIHKNWPPDSFDFHYTNKAGRRRGKGLTLIFDPANSDEQTKYEFLPPEGLRTVILSLR